MIIEFPSSNQEIVFCFIDYTNQYSSQWTKQLIINQSDFTITNLIIKGYTVLQGLSEDIILREASKKFNHAVVFTTGTEFINGLSFFQLVEEFIKTDYFIAGHILDRKEAYYELHHQCYIINLEIYKNLNYPKIGKQNLGESHEQIVPNRSLINHHDDYTPISVSNGKELKKYHHKCHGWNILSLAFSQNLPIIIFNDDFRKNKKYYYPENQKEFIKHCDWIYQRERACSSTFVHTENTECSNFQGDLTNIEQIFTPASGTWWTSYIKNQGEVIFYDYNDSSLNYWKNNAPVLNGVTYKFCKIDLLLGSFNITDYLDISKSTLINLSNIFAYEGTTFLTSLEKRLYQENLILTNIKENIPDSWIGFSSRSSTGFVKNKTFSKAIDIDIHNIEELRKPTWHINGDWND
jgi:hypothetical protein